VPNRFTRVPEEPVPSLPAGLWPLIAVADAFMWVLASRPATGSLRHTWVTPGTLQLCLAVAAGAFLLALALPLAGVPAGLLALPVALGAGAVGSIGLLQRRAARAPGRRR